VIKDSVFVLGAGPVAIAVAGALAAQGQPPIGLWARRPEAAAQAAKQVGIPHFSGPWPAEMASASILLLAVRDDAIAALAERLAKEGDHTKGRILLHCAGSQAAEAAFALVPAAGKGMLHPLRAIVDPAEAIDSLSTSTFGLEGDAVGKAAARRLCDVIGASSLSLSAEQVPAYHAAAALASNYLVSLIDFAQEVLRSSGVDGDAAEALLDLAGGALENIRREGIPNALTGPIRRGDAATVASHLEAVCALGVDNTQLYSLLAKRAVAMSQKLGDAEARDIEEISRTLDAVTSKDRQKS